MAEVMGLNLVDLKGIFLVFITISLTVKFELVLLFMWQLLF